MPSSRPAAGLDRDGRRIDPLQEAAGRSVVLLFVTTECPISNRYAPEINDLHRRFADREVRFWLVYPDPDDSPSAIAEHRAAFALRPESLRDPDHDLVRRVGATVTPEAALFDRGGRLAYRGRIDDLHTGFGKRRRAPSRRDLRRALDAVLRGDSPEVARTRAVGCYIRDLG